jgi:ompA family outer membrane protein
MNIIIRTSLVAVILLLTYNTHSYGQKQILSTANKKAKTIYTKAIEDKYRMSVDEFCSKMKKAIDADKMFVDPYWAIAEANNGDKEKSIEILELAIKNNAHRKDETLKKLADILKNMGRYGEAQTYLRQLSDTCKGRQTILDEYNQIMYMIEHPVPFSPQNLIYANTTKDEYFPSVTADDKILSVTMSSMGNYASNEDLYWSKKDGGRWTAFVPIKELNSPTFNEGSQTISADGRYMFFVACNMPEGFGSCDIYYSICTDGVWSKPINAGKSLNTSYWESNPSLSSSGDELFFTSNRPPTYGGRDLWYCRVEQLSDGKLRFSNPENLGQAVNSPQDDYAPYIHADNRTLYFLSKGHLNFGGSDIFVSRRGEDGKWSKAKNIGYPINKNTDCYGFTLNGAGDKGYISLLNTDEKERGIDVYEFRLHEEARPSSVVCIKGRVEIESTLVGSEKQRVGNKSTSVGDKSTPVGSNPTLVGSKSTRVGTFATVEIFDYLRKKPFFLSHSDSKTGEFTLILPDSGEYGLNVRKSGYVFYSSKIDKTKDTLYVLLSKIERGKSVVLDNIFFAFDSFELDPKSDNEIDRLVSFLKDNPSVAIEIVGHTDNIGSEKRNRVLSENRALSVMKALVAKGIDPSRLVAKGLGMSAPVASNATEEGRQLNRRVECVVR